MICMFRCGCWDMTRRTNLWLKLWYLKMLSRYSLSHACSDVRTLFTYGLCFLSSKDYVQRTVTMDPHPHLGTLHASVHPCKHAITMKRIVDALSTNGNVPKTAQWVHSLSHITLSPLFSALIITACVAYRYMFIFLKFMGSVVPTIEYDFTMSTAARSD